MRFGSRSPFVSDTSPKCIEREGLERRRIGTGQQFEEIFQTMPEGARFRRGDRGETCNVDPKISIKIFF